MTNLTAKFASKAAQAFSDSKATFSPTAGHTSKQPATTGPSIR